jgi:hypothetical protein
MTDVLVNEDRSLIPYKIYSTLNNYRKHLDPEILIEIQNLFGENFKNLRMGRKSEYFLERLKTFWVPLEKIKKILRTHVEKKFRERMSKKEFQEICDWDELGLVTFRNHAWLSNLEPHLKDEDGKYVIQMGRKHVEHFTSILKKKYPPAEIETFKLQEDIDKNQKDPTIRQMRQKLIELSKVQFDMLLRAFLDGKKLR